MLGEHQFAVEEVYPSWFPNALSRFLSLAAFNFQVTKQDDTHIQVMAGVDEDAAIIAVGGLWRYNEATITRAHPGGAAGTFDVFVTATNNSIAGTSDTTNYEFGLVIEPAGTTPTVVAGTVDQYRKVGSLQWDGAKITRIDQSIPAVARHAHSHATGQADPIAPVDIGAATEADLTAEVARAQAAEAAEAAARNAANVAEANARAAGDANNPTAAQKAALAGTSGAPGAGNLYLTDADPRNSNARAPTAHAGTHAPGGSDPLAVDQAANVGSLRTLGAGATQAAAGNDARFSDARAPTAHAGTHLPNGADPLATAAAATLTFGQGNTTGVANAFARSDHTHVVNSIGGTVAAGAMIISSKLAAADANPAFTLAGNGDHAWGPGGAGATDVTLRRTGAAALTISGVLTIAGAGTAFAVTNNAAVGGTLGVTGNSTLNGTLTVVGTSALQGTLTAAAINASGKLSLTGAGTALAVTNNATVGGTLAITGTTTAAAINASGNVTLSAGASVATTQPAGNTVLTNSLVAGDANAAFTIKGDGTHSWGPGGAGAVDTTLSRVAAGAMSFSGSLAVNRAAVGYGNLDVYGTIRASATNAGSGKGIELSNDGANAWVIGYDHTAAAYMPVQVKGTQATLQASGNSATVYVDNAGDAVLQASSGAIVDAEGAGPLYMAAAVNNHVYIRTSGTGMIRIDQGGVWTVFGGPFFPCANNAVQTTYQVYNQDTRIWNNGTGWASVQPSSRELKTKIRDLANVEAPLERLKKLRAVSFTWKADGRPDNGFILEEVEQVFPELVLETTVPSTGEHARGLDMNGFLPPMWEAVRVLLNKVETLEARLEAAGVA